MQSVMQPGRLHPVSVCESQPLCSAIIMQLTWARERQAAAAVPLAMSSGPLNMNHKKPPVSADLKAAAKAHGLDVKVA